MEEADRSRSAPPVPVPPQQSPEIWVTLLIGDKLEGTVPIEGNPPHVAALQKAVCDEFGLARSAARKLQVFQGKLAGDKSKVDRIDNSSPLLAVAQQIDTINPPHFVIKHVPVESASPGATSPPQQTPKIWVTLWIGDKLKTIAMWESLRFVTDLQGAVCKRFGLIESEAELQVFPGKLVGDEVDRIDNTSPPLKVTQQLDTINPPHFVIKLVQDPSFSLFNTDGVVVHADTTLPREQLVSDIVRKLDETGLVLLKAPPGAGKTSLLSIICSMLRRQGHRVTFFPFAPGKGSTIFNVCTGYYPEEYEDTTASSSTAPAPAPVHYVLMDECHHVYEDTQFWIHLVKWNLRTTRNLRILAAATRRYTTTEASPIGFTVFGFDQLRATDLEATQLVEKFCNRSYYLREAMSEHLTRIVMQQCNNHIGAIVITLSSIHNIKMIRPDTTEDRLIWRMLSKEVTVQYTRLWGDKPLPISPGQENHLKDVMMGNAVLQDELHAHLVRHHVLVDNDTRDRLDFLSPLMERRFQLQLFPTRGNWMPKPDQIDEAIFGALERLDQREIKSNLDKTRPLPKETALQHLFDHALRGVLHQALEVVPEKHLGANGQSGSVDFFINNDLDWGIELVCGGNRLAQHLARFEDGAYSHVKRWRVVDFLEPGHQIKPNKEYKNRICVVFKQDYSGADVMDGTGAKLRSIQFGGQ